MAASLSPVTRWWAYVRGIAGTASKTEIAEAARVSQPTVSRWASGEIERASADVAVRLATAYDASVGEALVAAGVLDEAQLPVTIQRYDQPDDETLIALLSERLRRDREDGDGHGGQPAPIAPAAPYTDAQPAGLTEPTAFDLQEDDSARAARAGEPAPKPEQPGGGDQTPQGEWGPS